MKFIIHGALGRMGRAVEKALTEQGHDFIKVDINFAEGEGYKSILEVSEPSDAIIDFSFHTATPDLLRYATQTNTPVVLCSTGHTEEEKELIMQTAKKVAIFYSGNMSVGIAVLSDLVKKAVRVMGNADVEIVEVHHNKKVDAPSGTALMLYDAVKEEREEIKKVVGRNGYCLKEPNEVGISSVRLANVVGIHEVLISDGTQTLTLKHEAHDRSLFALGAVDAAKFLANKGAGLYDMKKMLQEV